MDCPDIRLNPGARAMLRRARTEPFISDLGIGRGHGVAVRLSRPPPAIAVDRRQPG